MHPAIFIVVILSIFHLGFQPGFNEEIYFGLAKAYMDPDWIPGNTLFNDFPGTRILFQSIFGWILKYLSFEQLAFTGRLTGFILLSIPLASITRYLKIHNAVVIFWFTVFLAPQKTFFYITLQSFFAGEWVFGGFETKILAYVLVFWSVWFLFKKNYLWAILTGVFSIYWHMLVGGWYCLYLFIFLIILYGLNRRIMIYWFISGLLLLPLVIYLYSGLMTGSENQINGVNIGQIYAYIRNPHHIGILKSWDYFFHYHAGKVLIALAALGLAVFIYRKKIPRDIKWINTFLIIILIQNLLFLVVALFDPNGTIAKFYPWRGSTMAMFFFQLATLIFIREVGLSKLFKYLKYKLIVYNSFRFYRNQLVFLLLLSFAILLYRVINRYNASQQKELPRKEVISLSESLNTLSVKGERFMFLGEESLLNISIPRRSERDIYYMFRCVPSRSSDIYDWYMRGLEQERVKKDIDRLITARLFETINYVVSTTELKAGFLEEIYRSDNYFIYRLQPFPAL